MSAFLVVFSLFRSGHLNFLHFQKIKTDGQKMAKAAMALYGIDLDQQACVGVETAAVSASPAAAAAPGQFWRRATALLRSLRLGASANRASGDDSEQRGHICECPVSQAIELPHVVTEGAARLIGGGATSGSVAAGDLPRVLPSRERLGLVRRGAVGAGLLYRWRRRWLEKHLRAGEATAVATVHSSDQGCHPPPAPRRRSASRPNPRS